METMQLEGELQHINQQLWDIEDKIRDKERNNSFDDEFIQPARKTYTRKHPPKHPCKLQKGSLSNDTIPT